MIALGVHAAGTVEAFDNFEELIGRQVAVHRQYRRWLDPLVGRQAQDDKVKGRTPLISWRADDVAWTSIAAGEHDDRIAGQAAELREYAAPLVFSFHHEPEEESPDTWGTPADYCAAWRRIVNTFRQAGATNVRTALILRRTTYRELHGPGSARANDYWPGPRYIDFVAVDGYNKLDEWLSFADIFQPAYRFARLYDKPLIVAEFGSQEGTKGRKAAWFRDADRWLRQRPRVKAACYFSNSEYRIDSSPSSLSTFRAMVTASYWNGAL